MNLLNQQAARNQLLNRSGTNSLAGQQAAMFNNCQSYAFAGLAGAGVLGGLRFVNLDFKEKLQYDIDAYLKDWDK
jgi:hypothetical protein